MPDGTLYVPTRHEHGDGKELAHFDHTLYAVNADRSFGRAQPRRPKRTASHGLKWDDLLPGNGGGIGAVDGGGAHNIYQRRMIGMLENSDQYVVFNAAPASEQEPAAVERPVHPALMHFNETIAKKTAARAPQAEVV